jgi:hypothetical protein
MGHFKFHPKTGKRISGMFGGLTILFLFAMTAAIGGTIFAKARGLVSLPDFGLVFGGIETLLAVYFAQLAVALFELPERASKRKVGKADAVSA